MRHARIRLVVVTGGPHVVSEAMNSGKKVVAAGPGNPPVVVDDTADIAAAARHITAGASLDNNIVCSDEKEVVVVESVADRLLAEFARADAVVLGADEAARMSRYLFSEERGPRRRAVMNREVIGKDAAVHLAAIGKPHDASVRLVVLPVSVDHPLMWTEQMTTVLPVARVSGIDEAIDTALALEHGHGHTAVMHSTNIDHLSRMARTMDTCIFVKNGSAFAGLGLGGEGPTSFTIAHPTGDGLTDARTFSRIRRCTLVDRFRIV